MSDDHLEKREKGTCRRTDDEEQPEWLVRVLDLRQERRREAERQGDLRRLVKVRLEDVPELVPNFSIQSYHVQLEEKAVLKEKSGDALVENEEALEDLQLVLVEHRLPDLVVQLLVRERLLRLQALVRQRGPTKRRSRPQTKRSRSQNSIEGRT